MLFSRSNLAAVRVASRDKSDLPLHQLRVEEDGTTVASDGHVVMAVEPLEVEERKRPDGFPPASESGEVDGRDGFGVLPDVVETAIRNMPKGANALLRFAVLTKNIGGRVELSSTDLTKWQRVEGRVARKPFPEWRSVLKGLKRKLVELFRRSREHRRLCVDRGSLIKALQALHEACPSPDNAVFIEFGEQSDGLLMRCMSVETGQRAIAVLKAFKLEGEAWLPMSRWEQKVLGRQVKRLKRSAKR